VSTDNIKEVVKEKYGEAALRVGKGGSACCGSAPSTASGCGDPITSNLYDASQAGQIPEEAMLASLGCGNPTALAKLNPGETVLDLGSGGGIDVLLSARRVGPTGRAYGLDMTDEMPWSRTTIAQSSRQRDSTMWIWSRRAFIALKTPANSSQARTSMSMRLRRKWTENS
jgi:hypothetical protein